MNRILISLLASYFISGCASDGDQKPTQPEIVYFGSAYYYVPQDYHAHCRNKRFTIYTDDGDALSGDAGIQALNNSGASRITNATELEGMPVLSLQTNNCSYGYARYRQPPRLVIEAGNNHSGNNGRGQIDMETGLPGGLDRPTRGGGSLDLP